MSNDKCWICGRNRQEVKKDAPEYWNNENTTENLTVPDIEGALYHDVGFENIKIKKQERESDLSHDTTELPVCAICAKIVRTIVKGMLNQIKVR